MTKIIEQEILKQTIHKEGDGLSSADIIKENKCLLKNLLEEQEKETLFRTRYLKCNEMDAPTEIKRAEIFSQMKTS